MTTTAPHFTAPAVGPAVPDPTRSDVYRGAVEFIDSNWESWTGRAEELAEEFREGVIDPVLVTGYEALIAELEAARETWSAVAAGLLQADAACQQAGDIGWVSSAAEGYRAEVAGHGRALTALRGQAQEIVAAHEACLSELRSSPLGQVLGS